MQTSRFYFSQRICVDNDIQSLHMISDNVEVKAFQATPTVDIHHNWTHELNDKEADMIFLQL